jgi:diguanylate cyclase (GGDEF)-like protein/PAS domain S-box-containing protein
MRPLSAPAPDGVLLHSERPHVRAKLGVVDLHGEGWEDRLAETLDALTASERGAVSATLAGVTIPADQALARVRSPWLPGLLENGGRALFPHFQPIVSLDDGRVHGYESLIRARLGDRELSGGEIFGAARAHQATFALDQRGRAVALEHGLPLLPTDAMLYVNFTPSAIYDPDVCLRTTWAIARRLGFPLSRVCFEVVETETFPDVAFLQRILDRYRAEGAKVALDDLGAGHSSLTYLRLLRPDVVKLDRELISGIDGDPSRQRLVSALLDYAHELGVRVVGEGIETEGELAVVRELGADLGQGWYLGRPAAQPQPVDPGLVRSARDPRAVRTRDEARDGTTITLRDRALAAATSGVTIADAGPDHPIVYVNPAFERMTGYRAAEILGTNCRVLQGEGTDPAAAAELRDALREHREAKVTLRNYRRDGTAFWNEVHLSPVRDEDGTVVHYIGVQHDVTARVEAEAELRRLATRDPLTGLPNRAALQRLAQDAIAAGEQVALLFADLDGFKRVNDALGHDAGDALLCDVAARLAEAAGADALVARHAGDEFAVLLRDAGELVARRALAAVEAAVPEASVGFALFPDHAAEFSALLRRADAAMYARKQSRRVA